MMQQPDTVYGNRVDKPVSASYDLSRPWAPGEAAKCAFAMATLEAPEEVLRAIEPPLPQIVRFPDRFGLQHADITVEDCVSLDRDHMERYDFSGSEGSYSGTSTPSLQAGW